MLNLFTLKLCKVLIEKLCEELYSVINSVNDINPMSLTVFFVVLSCFACRRKIQFLPSFFFHTVMHVPILYSPKILSCQGNRMHSQSV